MQDLFDRLQQQVSAKEQEVEAGHQVSHAEDADARRPRDEDDGEDEPEEVAEHDDLQHVEVGPGGQRRTSRIVSRCVHWHDMNDRNFKIACQLLV